jgi:hypothetical protein
MVKGGKNEGQEEMRCQEGGTAPQYSPQTLDVPTRF